MDNGNIVSRNKSHDLAMQAMYSFLMLETCNQTIDVVGLLELIFDCEYTEIDVYIRQLLLTTLKNQNDAINYLSNYLNNWKFNRLNYCTQAILLLAYCEYKYVEESDKAVVINIAVKLAKKYCDSNDYKFINAILDNCLNGK